MSHVWRAGESFVFLSDHVDFDLDEQRGKDVSRAQRVVQRQMVISPRRRSDRFDPLRQEGFVPDFKVDKSQVEQTGCRVDLILDHFVPHWIQSFAPDRRSPLCGLRGNGRVGAETSVDEQVGR